MNFDSKTKPFLVGSLLLVLTGCSHFMEQFSNNLSTAIMNQNDPEVVRQGAPAYLLLIDSLIEGDPEDESTLLAGAKLYTAYTAVFVEDAERAKKLADKAWTYARKGLCEEDSDGCGLDKLRFDDFEARLKEMGDDNMDELYVYATTWASWIKTHSEDWGAVADIPKVAATFRHIAGIDPYYDNGGVQAYLGVMQTLLPPALGGKPAKAKTHFESAIKQSGGRNLSYKVLFAERYARMIFNRKLHDNLLKQVLEADPVEPGITLLNVLAQEKARNLLSSGKQYF